jgi:hypothetical protein
LAASLGTFEVRTVADQGWVGISNGQLLSRAAAEFDVFVTVDRNLPFQQHLPNFDIAVILLGPKRTESQTSSRNMELIARLSHDETLGDRVLKVNHAGEHGAVNIYRGQRLACW